MTEGTKSRWLYLAIGLAVGLVLIGGSWFCVKRFSQQPQRDGLYAVFLTNNQVYFGRIEQDGRKALVLTGIYYIQYKDPSQPAANDISLLKLGNELHGPEDRMEINRDHVLFIEKLKPDGRVAKAIADYKETK